MASIAPRCDADAETRAYRPTLGGLAPVDEGEMLCCTYGTDLCSAFTAYATDQWAGRQRSIVEAMRP